MRLLCSLFALAVLLLSSFSTMAQYPDAQISDPHYPFYHGVASGDALEDRVILWTRVSVVDETLTAES